MRAQVNELKLQDTPVPPAFGAPPRPGSFRTSTQLMQDAVPANAVSVGGGERNQEALFANPFKDGREEALVIDAGGRLTYLQRSEAADTGWLQEPVAGLTGTFTEVVVAVHPDGDVWAFCVPDRPDNSGTVLPLRLVRSGKDECAWHLEPDAVDAQVPGFQSLYVSYSPDGGPAIVGGVTGMNATWLATIVANVPLPSGIWPPVMNAKRGAQWAVRGWDHAVGATGRVVGGGFLPFTQDGDTSAAYKSTNSVYVYYLLDGTALTRYVVCENSQATNLSPVTCSVTVGQFCGTWNVPNYTQWYPNGDVGFMYLDTDGDLVAGYCPPWWVDYTLDPYSWATAGLGFQSATCWQDADGKVHLFGTKQDDGSLHVLHQGRWASAADDPEVPDNAPPMILFLWTQAVPEHAPDGAAEQAPERTTGEAAVPAVGDSWYYPNVGTVVTVGVQANVAAFQLDPYPDYKPSELIKMSGTTAAEAYCICTQDVTTSGWQTDKVRLPQKQPAAPYLVSHYVADVTLVSTQGAPLPDRNVSVSATSLVEVQIGAVSYQVGPGRAVSVSTNDAGKLSISIAARGLNPPTVYLDADGLDAGTALDFAAQVNNFLAGQGTLPSQAGPLTAELLETAQVNPNLPGLGSSALADWGKLRDRKLTPQNVISHITNMYAQAAGDNHLQPINIDGYDDPQPIVGYVIQLWDPDRPAYQPFRTQEELDAYRVYRGTHAAYGGWWDDFTSWASDVWEGIKSGAAKVVEVVVSTVTEISVRIGGAIVKLGEMIIDSVEQAVHAVEAVFQMIADAITRVIDWLKSLFDFTDIWDTKKALQKAVRTLASYASETCVHYGTYAHGWFERQESAVRKLFGDMKVKYADTQLGDFQGRIPTATDAAGAPLSQQSLGDSPQGNWLLNQAHGQQQRHPGSMVLARADGDSDDPFAEFMSALTGNGIPDAITRAVTGVTSVVAGMVDLNDPDTAHAGIAQVLTVLEDLLVDLLKALDMIVAAALEFGKKAADGLMGLFDYELDWGFINILFDWVQKSAGVTDPDPLTLGGLVCLLGAFPLTVVYKLAMGVDHAPFPGGEITMPQPPPWHSSYAAYIAQPQDPATYNQAMAWLQAGFNTVGGFLCTFFAPLNDMDPKKVGIPEWLAYAEAIGVLLGCSEANIPTLSVSQDQGDSAWASPWTGVWLSWTLYAFMSFFCAVHQKTALKNVAQVVGGPVVSGISGGVVLGLGIAALAEDANQGTPDQWPTWAATIAGPLSNIIQLARIPLFVGVDTPLKFGLKVLVAAFDFMVNGLSGLAPGLAALAEVGSGYPLITTSTLEDAYVSLTYRDGYRTLGGNLSFNAPLQNFRVTSGSLPLGMDLDQQAVTRPGSNKNCWFTGAPVVSQGSPFIFSVECTDSFQPPQYSKPRQFSLTVRPTPVTGLRAVSGQQQSAPTGAAFPSRLAVDVTISGGKTGAAVHFTAPPGAASATGSFEGGRSSVVVTSDANGIATAPTFTANAIVGSYQVAATVLGAEEVPAVVFNLRNTTAADETALPGGSPEPGAAEPPQAG